MDPALQELIDTRTSDKIEAILRLRDPRVPVRDLEIIARFGDIATARIRRDVLRDVWSDPRIASVKAPRLLSELDEELYNVGKSGYRPNPPHVPFRGRGVIVAVLDWGFDIASPAFRDASGKSRIRAIWKQSAPSHHSADDYGYGRIFTQEQLNQILVRGKPLARFGLDVSRMGNGQGTHGTHVADIAAGSPRNYAPAGMASEAELIFVDLSTSQLSGRANLGDSVRLLEAMDFVRNRAGARPFVINCSLGRHGGPGNGKTLVERAVDNLIAEAPGRAVVMSTGNYRNAQAHRVTNILAGRRQILDWEIAPQDLTTNEMEVWYPNRDRLKLSLRAPNGQIFKVKLGENSDIVISGDIIGRIYHRAYDPNTPDHHIDIFLYPHALHGTWQVSLFGESIADGRCRISIERDGGRSTQSRLSKPIATKAGTIGSICNGYNSIAVGAVHPKTRRPAYFSSEGPTRDGRQKPDIAAYGVKILAEKSGERHLVAKTGASQAAPQVTGYVALLFEAALPQRIDIDVTKQVLLGTSQRLLAKRSRVGAGLVKIERAISRLRTILKQRE